MADATSTLKVEVDSDAFDKFAKAFKQHQYEVGKASPAWNKLQQQLRATNNVMGQFVLAQHMWQQLQAKNIAKTTAAAAATATQVNNVRNATNQAANQTNRLGIAWGGLARTTGAVAGNMFNILRSVLRWSAIGTGIGGLLGVGGFFGLRGLGRDVSQGRRASLGLGLSYGERTAFGVNYGRLVDSEGFLGGVNEALSDVTKRYSLYAAGLGEGDLASGDTGKISVQLLQRLKELADRTPRNLLGQVVSSRGLGQFGIGVQELLRLKNISREELAGYASRYSTDAGALSITEDTQRRWQDFYVQLNRAGANLENVFVRGLEKLTPSLERLSVDLTNFLKGLTESPHFQEWVTSISQGVEGVAKYIGSEKFQTDVKNFSEDVGKLASGIHWLLSNLPSSWSMFNRYTPEQRQGIVGGTVLKQQGWSLYRPIPMAPYPWNSSVAPSQQGSIGNFNFGNIRKSPTEFMKYASAEEGVLAIANLLLHGTYFKGKNTIRQIESVYAPPSENDTHYLIKKLAERTHIDANQPLDLNNRETLATIISGITRQEGVRSLSKEVVIKILNQTGGSATLSVSAAAGGG